MTPFRGLIISPKTYLTQDALCVQRDNARESSAIKLNRSSLLRDRGAKCVAKVRGKLLESGLLSGLIQLVTARQANNRHSIIRLGPSSNPVILHPL